MPHLFHWQPSLAGAPKDNLKMLDHKIRPYIDPALEKIARLLNKYNISPNTVTFTGAMVAVLCFIALANRFYVLALIFLLANRIADGLDGILAQHIDKKAPLKKKGQSAIGSYLDTVCDMFLYGGFVCFYALGRSDVNDAAVLLLFSFMMTASSFLAYGILVEKAGEKNKSAHKNKGFYHSNGLIEGSETIIAFVLMCLFPDYFNEIASLFALACFITAALRIKSAYKTYRK